MQSSQQIPTKEGVESVVINGHQTFQRFCNVKGSNNISTDILPARGKEKVAPKILEMLKTLMRATGKSTLSCR